MNRVHDTAYIAAGARLEEGVCVGPYAVIEDDVEIGAGTVIGAHAVIHSFVHMGRGNRISPHVVLGGEPQDVSFKGLNTRVEIGDNNVFREYVTIHRATKTDRPTALGSNCYLMAHAHVAHDCQVGDCVTLTNCATLAGHVQIGEQATLGGFVPVHQFVRIGAYAMVGGGTRIRKDVLPYSLAAGDPARHYRLNIVGLRRVSIVGERFRALEAAFRALRRGRSLDGLAQTAEIALLRAWLAAPSKRGLSGFVGQDEVDMP
ncbi:MAG TPA: acyl-ACP--UDP-N-acetylglucosamine O-acyltransferase [Gammaproteobacteria bacterium]|nr:acyl-ACP--UDP-N-acetylglucosamine O-acyltransferase [Gammaproteobacteria bacterium]